MSERDRMARMQQFDHERFRHLNVELLKVEERARDMQRGRDQLLVQLHELRFQVRHKYALHCTAVLCWPAACFATDAAAHLPCDAGS